MKLLNSFFLLKLVGEPDLYLGGDVVTAEISGEVMNDFLAHTYIKNVTDNIEKSFGTTLNNYRSPLEGVYYPFLNIHMALDI